MIRFKVRYYNGTPADIISTEKYIVANNVKLEEGCILFTKTIVSPDDVVFVIPVRQVISVERRTTP